MDNVTRDPGSSVVTIMGANARQGAAIANWLSQKVDMHLGNLTAINLEREAINAQIGALQAEREAAITAGNASGPLLAEFDAHINALRGKIWLLEYEAELPTFTVRE